MRGLAHGAEGVGELWWRVEGAAALEAAVVASAVWVGAVCVHEAEVARHHLVVFCHEVVFSWIVCGFVCTNVAGLAGGDVVRAVDSAFVEGEHGVRACHAQAVNDDGELAEEIDDALAAVGQSKDKQEWCNDHAEDLFSEDEDLRLIELCKLGADLIGV